MTSSSEPARRLAAVWFADIVGYTTLSQQDEDGALKVVNAFQRICSEVVPQYSGRIVKYIGDAALAEFASTDGAIRSALALMERFHQDPAVTPRKMTLRVGVNVGEVMAAPDGDIYGDGVNLASRLQNQAQPGQVVASEAVHAQIRQRPVFRTEALGHKAVKGIAAPVQIYAVSLLEPGMEPEARPAAQPPAPAHAARRPVPKAAWLIPVGALAAAAVVAVGVLGAGEVSVVRATYPVVEGGLQVDAPITLEFTGALDRATVTSQNIRLMDPQGQPVPAEVSLGADERSIVLDPQASLGYAQSYSVAIGGELLSAGGAPVKGVAGEDAGSSVVIRTQAVPADAARPRLELAIGFDPQAVPATGPVRVRFSEAIDPASAVAGGIRLATAAGAPVQAELLFTDGNREVRLGPVAPLTGGARYVVLVDSTLAALTGLVAIPDRLELRVAARAAQTAAAPAPASGGEATPARTAGGSGTPSLNLTVVPVAAQPFIKVVIDGDTVGPAPLRGFALSGGEHTVVLVGVPELSSFALPVFRQTVIGRPGEVLELAAQITQFGSVDIVSEPAGVVFIDGRQVGRTPLAGYPVAANANHRIEIRPNTADQTRFAPYTADFRVAPLEWKSLGRVALPARQQ